MRSHPRLLMMHPEIEGLASGMQPCLCKEKTRFMSCAPHSMHEEGPTQYAGIHELRPHLPQVWATEHVHDGSLGMELWITAPHEGAAPVKATYP